MLVHPQFDPVALDLSKIGIPIAVHWYGITYLVGFGLFLFLANRRARLPQFAATAASDRRCRPALHGVMVEWPLATPIIGLSKSSFL